MPNTAPRRYRVPRKVLDRGARIEAQEHPGFGPRTTTRIARQHIQRYGPGIYSPEAEKAQERMADIQNKKMHAHPINPAHRFAHRVQQGASDILDF